MRDLAASIGEVAHRLSTYMPHLSEWADRARDCKKAADVLSALAALQPVGQPVEHACTNCERTDAKLICPACAGTAWDNGRLHEFHETRELSTSLGDSPLDHLLPEDWHEKPLLRFRGAYDEGEDSVGISPAPPMSWPTIRPAPCWATI